VKSERDVLARQSQLLMMDAASDEKIMKLLFEVEQLQRTISEERQEHAEQIKYLQVSIKARRIAFIVLILTAIFAGKIGISKRIRTNRVVRREIKVDRSGITVFSAKSRNG
jgi:hypothetical protein